MADKEKESTVVAFPTKEKRKPSSTEMIWGKDIIRHGYTAVPNILLQAQQRLGISATQLNIIVQLLEYWQKPEKIPYPSKQKLADRIGCSPKTIQTNVRQLENVGLIKRKARLTSAGDWDSNAYDLSPLVERVRKLEPGFQKAREEREAAREELTLPAHKRRPRK